MKRAAIYSRTPEGQDLDDQLVSLHDYCSQQGWEVVQQYHDKTLLGAKDRRKQQDNLLRDARNNCFDIVVVVSLSAWGKNLKQIVDTISALKQQGVLFVSLQDTIDPETVEALKHFQKAQKSEKVKAGMMIARLRGLQIGRTPLPKSQVASIIQCFENGHPSVREISKRTSTSRSSVHKAISQHKANLMTDHQEVPVQGKQESQAAK